MLSILIPVFNFEIKKLVTDLDHQCRECGILYEILCKDDGSESVFKNSNRKLSRLKNVVYTENEQNMGRSAIRNRLALEAAHPYLFFLDCDSGIDHQFHIRNYISLLDPQKVLYGGRIYQSERPEESELILHWHYGKIREQKNASERIEKPYHSFMSNNFLIPKELFLSILFDESLTQYGHEDTLFGLDLQKKKIEILHIDNPLIHIGLENNKVFISKTKTALYNLIQINTRTSVLETKLLKYHRFLKRFYLLSLFQLFYRIFQGPILHNLLSSNPNLFLFDLFKIGELIQLSKTSKITK